MFSLAKMPSTTAVLSTYTTFAASAMLVRTMVNEVQTLTSQLIPKEIREKILSKLGGRIRFLSSEMTLVIEEYNGYVLNQVYEAAEMYLRTKIAPSVERLRVSMAPREKNLLVTIKEGEKTVDTFDGISLVWQMIKTESQKTNFDYDCGISTEKVEKKSIELTFNSNHKEMVLNTYLPLVMECSKAIKKENKVVKLNQLGGYGEPVNLDHPSNFDTIAMDPAMKKELMDDLDRFVRRRDFYRRVGKAWKRGYLLYGPPGTGKSSLIAAMANYLKFDVYDLELTSMTHNNDLRNLLVSTANQSILVIEDIDCSIDLENREDGGNRHTARESQLTLSGLLNFMDGLWSSCGDERIIVVTTNHKDRLDPALLRPGRMDMHIHLSYCTPSGFRILASNYLCVDNHYMFGEIEKMITKVEVTPAEVAEEMMRSDEADVALGGLLKLLQKKKMEKGEGEEKEEVVNEEGKKTKEDMDSGNENKGRKNKREARKGRGFTRQKKRR